MIKATVMKKLEEKLVKTKAIVISQTKVDKIKLG